MVRNQCIKILLVNCYLFIDLDDISQPDNGAQLSIGDGEMTDSESEVSAKEEECINEEDPPETLYFPNEEEEFGDAGAQVYNKILLLICCDSRSLKICVIFYSQPSIIITMKHNIFCIYLLYII